MIRRIPFLLEHHEGKNQSFLSAPVVVNTMFCFAAPAAAAETRDALLNSAAACWRLGNGGESVSYPLTAVGDIQLDIAFEGEGATPGAMVARLKEVYFDAGRDFNLDGNQCRAAKLVRAARVDS